MANKTDEESGSKKDTPTNTFAQLQEVGVGNMLGVSTAWMEALSDMGAEFANFFAERIKEDVKTQHKVLHCNNIADLQHIQAQFIQKAMEQYQTETGKLVDMSAKVFSSKPDDPDQKS